MTHRLVQQVLMAATGVVWLIAIWLTLAKFL